MPTVNKINEKYVKDKISSIKCNCIEIKNGCLIIKKWWSKNENSYGIRFIMDKTFW